MMKPYIKGIPRCIFYAYTPVHGLVCIIYTSYVLCSPEERFNSSNESISSDRYRQSFRLR